MSSLDLIATKIIKEQELIIGPMAWLEAGKVNGMRIIDQAKGAVSLEGDGRQIVNSLVSRYENLFGRASTEVCKEAVAGLLADLPPEEIPTSLQ